MDACRFSFADFSVQSSHLNLIVKRVKRPDLIDRLHQPVPAKSCFIPKVGEGVD